MHKASKVDRLLLFVSDAVFFLQHVIATHFAEDTTNFFFLS